MTDAPKGHTRAGLIILICVFIAAIEGYDVQAFGDAAPRLVAELGLTPGQQGWAASAAMVGMFLAALYALAAAMDLSSTLIWVAVGGFLVMGAQFSLYGRAPGLYPAHVRAVGAGAAIAVGRVGAIIGPLIAGELRQAGFSGSQVFTAMIPMVLAAAAATLALSYVGKTLDE